MKATDTRRADRRTEGRTPDEGTGCSMQSVARQKSYKKQ